MRVHLFEFEDQSWFPDVIRTGGTDYLRYFLIKTELYKPVAPLIAQTLQKTGNKQLIDLCSGGGGYIEQVYLDLQQSGEFQVILTDKFPNLPAYRLLKEKTNGGIEYAPAMVDAAQVPPQLKGLRTMFSAVHHFKPGQVKSVLQDAVNNQAPIALFDGGEKGLVPMLGLLLIHPLAFLICTPFFKPFKLSRLFFTYVVPLIPLYTIWDGLVSILRMYRPEELQAIAESLGDSGYVWQSGKTKNRFGIHASYLIGYPKKYDQ